MSAEEIRELHADNTRDDVPAEVACMEFLTWAPDGRSVRLLPGDDSYKYRAERAGVSHSTIAATFVKADGSVGARRQHVSAALNGEPCSVALLVHIDTTVVEAEVANAGN